MASAQRLPKPPFPENYGRDPKSAAEQLRRKTNYEKGTGYSPLFHAMVADIPRLSRGASCTHLLMAIWAHTDRGKLDGWTPFLSLDDWANLAYCDSSKEVMRNRDYLKDRKMADVQTDTKRRYAFRLRPADWQKLEDYRTWVEKQAPADDAAADDGDDAADEKKRAAGNWRMSKPAKVGRGKTSKLYKPDVGIAGFKFRNDVDNPVDVQFFAVVKAGELLITPSFQFGAGEAKAKDKANKDTSHGSGGHGRPREPQKGSGRTKGETDPRAAEIVKIFDPLLQKSGSRLISFDLAALKQACVAIGQTDFGYVREFMTGPNGRAQRNVSGPRAVVKICEEIKRNYTSRMKRFQPLRAPEPAAPACKRCGDTGLIGKDGKPATWEFLKDLRAQLGKGADYCRCEQGSVACQLAKP